MRILAAAAALLAAAAVPAHAGHAGYRGGCDYSIRGEPTETTGEGFEVVVEARLLVYAPGSPTAPVSADVTCTLVHHQPDGSIRPYEFGFSGTTLVTGTGSVRLPADISPQDLGMCIDVTFDGEPVRRHTCYDRVAIQIPPQFVYDVADEVLGNTPGSHGAVCAATAGAAPLAAGGVLVNSEGDVYADGHQLWYC